MLFTTLAAAALAVSMETHTMSTPLPYGQAYSAVAELPAIDGDSRFSYGEDALQYALVYGQQNSQNLLLVHGGCWLNSFDLNHLRPLAMALADEGFRVVLPEYRRIGDKGGAWPGTYNDIESVYLAAKEKFPGPWAMAGHSAGGHLAVLSGGANNHDPRLKGVVGIAAITDLIRYAQGDRSCNQAAVALMHGTPEQTPENYKNASPSRQPLHTNTLLLQGVDDPIVLPEQAELAGARTILLTDANHFDMIHPQTGAFSALVTHLRSLFTHE